MKSREEILEFVRNYDFAYVWGAGKMFAGDFETKEYIAQHVENINYILIVEDVEEEGCGCDELKDEEGVIYKFYNWNEEPMYIAIYM